jgi:hypothetical protein
MTTLRTGGKKAGKKGRSYVQCTCYMHDSLEHTKWKCFEGSSAITKKESHFSLRGRYHKNFKETLETCLAVKSISLIK